MIRIPRLSLVTALCVAVFCSLLTGCGSSKKPNFYSIDAVAYNPQGDVLGGPILAIEPVAMNDELNQKKIVVQNADGSADVMEFERWVGDPDAAISKAIAANLSTQIPTERVYPLPWKPVSRKDYTLAVNVFEMGLYGDNTVRLGVFWTIKDNEDTVRSFNRASYSQPGSREDFTQVATGISNLVGQLSADIADEIRKISREDDIDLGLD